MEPTDAATFFIEQPAIDADGTLTFALAPDVNGDVQLQVVARDNAGTTNPGDVDTSD